MTSPLEVEVNGDLERAFKNLKKKMAFEGVFKELKRRRYYEKPSAQKKRKQEEANRRRIKKIRRMMMHSQSKRIPGVGGASRPPYNRGPQSGQRDNTQRPAQNTRQNAASPNIAQNVANPNAVSPNIAPNAVPNAAIPNIAPNATQNASNTVQKPTSEAPIAAKVASVSEEKAE